MASLTEKVAIVTGGGHGVGRGIALALSGAGARLVLCGRTAATLAQTRADIKARGGNALDVVADITLGEDRARLVSEALSTFGKIDILVNNAAVVPHGSLLAIDELLIEQAWQTGPLATLQLMRLCHPHLRGSGVIINVSSAVALAASAPNRGLYAATKAALNAISRAAANEWGPDGIRVNTIMPFAKTDAVAQYFAREPEHAAKVLANVPLGRVGECELDIGQAVVFLAGPDSSYLTGATLPLDGGSAYLR